MLCPKALYKFVTKIDCGSSGRGFKSHCSPSPANQTQIKSMGIVDGLWDWLPTLVHSCDSCSTIAAQCPHTECQLCQRKPNTLTLDSAPRGRGSSCGMISQRCTQNQ